jgi:hypothetical protein
MNVGIGTVTVQFFSGNIFFEFSLMCLCCVVRMRGSSPPPFTISTITYKVVVYAPADRADILSLFLLYPYMYSLVHVRMTMLFECVSLRKCLLSRKYVYAQNCLYSGACPKIGMKRNLGMTVSDQLICMYFILRHHVVEVPNDLVFSIDVNTDSDNVVNRDSYS